MIPKSGYWFSEKIMLKQKGWSGTIRREVVALERGEPAQEEDMIVAIVTFHLARPTTVGEITTTFQATAPKYQGIPGLLRKNYFVSEDGRRAGGIYVWASRADADRVYTAEWKTFVEGKYGTPPVVEYLHSAVIVDK